MKSEEYIQTVKETFYLSNNIQNLLDIINNINEIRKLHIRLQNELEYFLIDPISYETETEKEKINSAAIEIKSLCTEYDIQCSFFKLPKSHSEFSDTFRDKKNFSAYYYKNINITNLIVYIKKKKFIKPKENKEQKLINELKNAEFHEKSFIKDERNQHEKF